MKAKLRKLAGLLVLCLTMQMLLPSAALAAETDETLKTAVSAETGDGAEGAGDTENIEAAESAEAIESAQAAESTNATETIETDQAAENGKAAEGIEEVPSAKPAGTDDSAQTDASARTGLMDVDAAVSSISYEPAIPYIAWLEQDFSYDEATGKYTCYSYNDSRWHGDRLTVTYEDGSEKVYVYSREDWEYINEEDPADTLSDSDVVVNMYDYMSGWELGGDRNYYEVSYAGASCKVAMEVKSTPVQKIEYLPVLRFLYSHDRTYGPITGDKVIVTYKDGSSETFVFDWDADPYYDPGYNYSRYGWGAYVSEKTGQAVPEYHPYDIYSEMTISHDEETCEDSIFYMGVSDVAEGRAYIATGISFLQSGPRVFLEGSGETRTDAGGENYTYYDLEYSDRFQSGDQLVVSYENSLGESRDITYTYGFDQFQMEDIGDGRDSNDYIYYEYVDLENLDQESNHFQAGETYSYNIRWNETLNEGEEEPDLVTTNSPYQIMIKGTAIADPSAIENPRVGDVYSWGFNVIWDDFVPPEGETPQYFRITGSYNGQEFINTQSYYDPAHGSDGVFISIYYFSDNLDFSEGKSYPVSYTLEALNADGQVIGISDSFSLTLSVTGARETPVEITLPDTLQVDEYSYIRTPAASIEYQWKVDGAQEQSWSTNKQIGTITGLTSSDPSVIETEGTTLHALGIGSAEITVSYTQNGAAKSLTKTVTVVDQYLMLTLMQEGVLNYETLAAGTSVNYLIYAYQFVYDSAAGSYSFAGDVTDQTDLQIETLDFIYSGAGGGSGTDYSDKIHASWEGNVLTISPDADLPPGQLFIKVTGSWGDVKGSAETYLSILPSSRILKTDGTFYFPLAGDSADLNLIYEAYENGIAVEETPAVIGIEAEGLRITDRNGSEVTDVCTMSQFPLTITNTGTESTANIRFVAYRTQEDYEKRMYACWLYLTEGDMLFFTTLTVPEPQVYTGQALTPVPTLKYGEKDLPLSDYNIEYYNNVNAGTATIRLVEKEGGYRDRVATFTIEKAEQALAASASASSILPGETASISVSGNKEDSVIRYRSSDESVASVSSTGVVTGKKAGSAVITITASETANYKQSETTLTIRVQSSGTPVESITLNQSEITIPILDTYQLQAAILPENADNKNIRWTSSDEAVAAVDQSGLVTARKYGTATIKATSLDDPTQKISASCTVHTLFGDAMDAGKYYYNPIYWAADKGITQGYSSGEHAGKFGVGLNCTRGELMVFLWRSAGSKTGYGDARTMFNDVTNPTTSAFNKAIAWAYKTGIVKGYSDGGIHPNDTIVRKDVMIMLYRLAGKPAVSGTVTFTDVIKNGYKTTSDTYKSILWGVKKGITNGYSSGEYKGQFGCLLNCQRQDIVTFLYRYYK